MSLGRRLQRQVRRTQIVAKRRRKLFFESLEPRLLLSSDPVTFGGVSPDPGTLIDESAALVQAEPSATLAPIADVESSDALQPAVTAPLSDGSDYASTDSAPLPMAANTAPVAVDDRYIAIEDTDLVVPVENINHVKVGVLANDKDVDGDTLTAVLASQPLNGTVTLNEDGSFTYTPKLNFNGADSFTYKANDGQADSEPATVRITVISVDDAPVAKDDSYTVNEDEALIVAAPGVLANDTDVDSPSLKAYLLQEVDSPPAHGSLTLDPEGSFIYWPTANFKGQDVFTYHAWDGTALSDDPARVTITVLSVNDAPQGTDHTVSTLEDTAYTFAAVDFGFSDPNDTSANSLLAVEITTLPTAGSLTEGETAVTAGQFINVSDIDAGKLVFTPAANGNGTGYASFSFQVQDDGGTANGGVDLDPTPKTMTVDVTPVNDAPQGTDHTVTTLEDTAYTFAAVDFGFSDPYDNPANSLLAVEITTLPSAGNLTDNGESVTAGQFIGVADITGGKLQFTPAANANGMSYASFSFQVQDDGGTLNGGVDLDPTPKTMTLDVSPVNDAPVATNDAYTTNEDTTLIVAAPGVLGNDSDVDGDALTAVLETGPAHGTLVLNTDGSFTYTPNLNFNGADSFTYKANDGTLDSNVAKVNISVSSVNDAPVALDDTASTPENTPVVLAVLANDTEVDGDPLKIDSFSQPGHGTVADNGDGTLTYTPLTNFTGEDSFTYTAGDGHGGSATAKVTVTVKPAGEVIIDAGNQAGDGNADTFRLVRTGTDLEVLVNRSVVLKTPVATAPLLKFQGSQDNDTLIVDFSGGNPIPEKGISYIGGSIGDIDMLVLTGGSASTVTYTFSGPSSGTAEVDGAIISYGDINAVKDTLQAADRTFLFGDGPDTIIIGDNGIRYDQVSRIRSAGSSVTVDFKNPVHSLTIDSGGGDDIIVLGCLDYGCGASFETILDGGAGDDVMDASRAARSVTLIGGAGNDILLGGRGNDVLIGGDGYDILRGGCGDDVLLGGAGMDLLEGGSGNDVLSGEEGSDLILGRDGNDVLTGDAGDDILLGGNGNDTLTGGDGNDLLDGGSGNDILSGGAGNDVLLGDYGNDLLSGGSGNDVLLGGAGSDVLFGDAGNDVLNGGPGYDVLVGGGGNDILIDCCSRNRYCQPFTVCGNEEATICASASWVKEFVGSLAGTSDNNVNSTIRVILASGLDS